MRPEPLGPDARRRVQLIAEPTEGVSPEHSQLSRLLPARRRAEQAPPAKINKIGSGDGAIDGWDLLTNIVQVHARRLQRPVLLCVLVDTDRQPLINLIVSGASRPFGML